MTAANSDPIQGDPAYGLVAHARERPEKVALVCDEQRLTYGELNASVNRLVRVLAAAGVEAGHRVALMVRNSFAFFQVGQAAAKLRATVVPINFHLKHEEIAYIVDDSDARVLVAGAEFRDEVAGALEAITAPARQNLFFTGAGALPAGATRLEGVMAAVDGGEPPMATATSGFNVMVYTSGTTGRPKGVLHPAIDPERAYQSQLVLAQTWGFRTDDIHLLVGPAYHTAPGAYSLVHLFMGATIVIMQSSDAEEMLRLIDRHRVTTVHMVPANFIRILDLPEETRRRYAVGSLRRVLHAAAPCPVDVKRRIMEYFPADAVWEYYGMTEGAGTIISPDDWRRKPGSVGRPWPGVQLRILDEDGRELGPNVPGLVYVSGQGGRRSFEYHKAPEKTEAAYRGEFFTVGDIGYLDEDGFLFIVDRKADMVISGGVNIYPAEVEAVLYRHPDIVDVAVIGVPDEKMGEQVKAVVEPRRGATLAATEVIEFCRSHIAHYKCPRSVEFVTALPRDPNGKVRKRELRERYWAGRQKRV
jgi:long-chain acyl-CoA synthetase